MGKIDNKSTKPSLIDDTIREMLGDPKILEPMTMAVLQDCILKLPFSIHMYWDKLKGLYICSNNDPDTWIGETTFSGVNFTIYDYTLESALGRAIHYYYHLKLKE